MSKIKAIIISLRPKQWIKNLLIFAPLLFSSNIFNKPMAVASLKCFLYFCLIASAGYLINDVLDKKEDKLHPLKSQRPIALGKLSVTLALFSAVLLFILSLSGITLMNNSRLLIIVVAYIVLNMFYARFVKHLAILDVISIALGFELRIWAGAVAISVPASEWLQVCTFLLALFLGFGKRRAEMALLKAVAKEHRKVLAEYSLLFLDQLIAICAGVTILAYALYTLSNEVIRRPGGQFMIYTLIFVVYGIFRYLYLIQMRKKSGDPTEMVTSDKPLIANLALWFLSILLILYLSLRR